MSYGFWTEHYSDELTKVEDIIKVKPVSLKMIRNNKGCKLEGFMEDCSVEIPAKAERGLCLRPKGSNTVFVLRYSSYRLDSVISFNNGTYQETPWVDFREYYGA